MLRKHLLSVRSALFDELSSTAMENICRHLFFARYNTGDVVFLQGDIGDAFYVVVSGKVSIHIQEDEQELALLRSDHEQMLQKIRRRRSVARVIGGAGGYSSYGRHHHHHHHLHHHHLHHQKTAAKKNISQFAKGQLGNVVAENGAGFAFGELALYSEEQNRRNASIVAEQESLLIKISKVRTYAYTHLSIHGLHAHTYLSLI